MDDDDDGGDGCIFSQAWNEPIAMAPMKQLQQVNKVQLKPKRKSLKKLENQKKRTFQW